MPKTSGLDKRALVGHQEDSKSTIGRVLDMCFINVSSGNNSNRQTNFHCLVKAVKTFSFDQKTQSIISSVLSSVNCLSMDVLILTALFMTMIFPQN